MISVRSNNNLNKDHLLTDKLNLLQEKSSMETSNNLTSSSANSINKKNLLNTSNSSNNMVTSKFNNQNNYRDRDKERDNRDYNRDRDRNSHRNGKSFRSRDKKNDEFLLQRPTILAKPASTPSKNQLEQQDNSNNNNKITIIRNSNLLLKDENQKPNTNNELDENLKKPIRHNESTKSLTNGLLLSKKRDLSNNSKPSIIVASSSSTLLQGKESTNQTPQVQVKLPSTPISSFNESILTRLSNQPFMTKSVKVLDDNLQWQDTLQDYLLDQNDHIVIGILGKAGVGKSTLMSLLAGCDLKSTSVFKTATKETIEQAQHKTNGINAFVTNERIILLDVQPILSCSLLDKTINLVDKKHLCTDCKYYENYIEIQSIEIVCFILSVCNVVLLTDEWFIDPNLIRLLQTAEMLLPNMNNSSGTGPGNSSLLTGSDNDQLHYDHYPHLVYILNKCDYVNKFDLNKMKMTLNNMMKDSKLLYKNSIQDFSQTTSASFQNQRHYKRKQNCHNEANENVNFVLLPKLVQDEKDLKENDEFKGLMNMNRSIKSLLREILAVKRNQSSFLSIPQTNQQQQQATNSTSSQYLSEKRWFMYANKVWETIRKSAFISEYNRLMT